jgi:hypothetical protein
MAVLGTTRTPLTLLTEVAREGLILNLAKTVHPTPVAAVAVEARIPPAATAVPASQPLLFLFHSPSLISQKPQVLLPALPSKSMTINNC